MEFDYAKLGAVVRQVVPFLDRVIDINYYPTAEAEFSNHKWRPVGLGLMGLQDVFFKLRPAFDSADAQRSVAARSPSTSTSTHCGPRPNSPRVNGPHAAYDETRAANGELQFDLWDTAMAASRRRPNSTGTRCAPASPLTACATRLLIAIAPTATIASIAGCYECIEPQVSNLFKRETLSGEFLQINRYLVRELQARGLWDEQMISDIKRAEGSVQDVERIPDELKEVFRTAWEIPQRALIDMAAERGAVHRPEPVAEPVHGDADHRQALLDVPARLEGRPEDHVLPAQSPGHPHQPDHHGRRHGTKAPPAPTPSGPTGGGAAAPAPQMKTYTDEEAVACCLENPESCEACD